MLSLRSSIRMQTNWCGPCCFCLVNGCTILLIWKDLFNIRPFNTSRIRSFYQKNQKVLYINFRFFFGYQYYFQRQYNRPYVQYLWTHFVIYNLKTKTVCVMDSASKFWSLEWNPDSSTGYGCAMNLILSQTDPNSPKDPNLTASVILSIYGKKWPVR